jgi:hypothetical protein
MRARVRGTGDVVRERGRREDTDGDGACDEAGHPCLFHLHDMFSPFGLGIKPSHDAEGYMDQKQADRRPPTPAPTLSPYPRSRCEVS